MCVNSKKTPREPVVGLMDMDRGSRGDVYYISLQAGLKSYGMSAGGSSL